MSTGSFPAPAKLNLFLHVLGRRPDGYHRLQTLFTFLDHGDTLNLSVRRDGDIVRVRDLPGVPAESDLCVRAARLLQAHARCRLGADIELVKRLPMGAGLGGGSSDAATVLLALNRLWGLDLPRIRLQELGLRLGADVPVFVFGQSAFGEGVGEELRAVELPERWYVVLEPPVEVATALVFSDPDLRRDTPPMAFEAVGPEAGRNDLEPVVRRRFPEVARHLDWLSGQGPARMTGSGAAVFAPFSDAGRAVDVLASRPAGVRGFVARGLNRHPLFDPAG